MMTKRPPKKSPAAQSLARKRWDAVPKSKRAGVNAAATAARWPKCSICGEREGHEVHDYAANVEYRHAYIAPFVAVKKKV